MGVAGRFVRLTVAAESGRSRRRLAGFRMFAGALAAVFSVSMLAACSGSDSGGSSDASTSTTVPTADLAGEFRLGEPFGELASLAMRSDALFSAVQERTQDCMEDRGLRYETTVLADPGGKGIAQLTMAVRLQAPDEVVGYGFSEWNAAQPVQQFDGDTAESVKGEVDGDGQVPGDPNAWKYELSEEERYAWNDALGGLSVPDEEKEKVTTGGITTKWAPDACTFKGQEAVYGSLVDWYRAFYMVTEEMVIEADEVLRADPVLQEAIESWAACMGVGGFEVTDLTDPIRQLWLRYPPGTEASESVAAEGAMAPVDARCFQEADLPTILGTAQRAVEADLLARNEGVVTAYVELYEAAVVRARGEN